MSFDIDSVHEEMLAEISNNYQKTIGFPTYDLTRAFALAVASLAGDLEVAMAKTDIDNLEGDELTKWCYERKGIVRTEAIKATATIKATDASNGTVLAGSLFETAGGIQFEATQTVANVNTGTTIPVRAVVGGASGNVAASTITVIPVTIIGVFSVTNEAAASGGYDAETDAHLRERYIDAINHPASSGNKYAYANWAREVAGVGSVKVFPLANGNNTVEVCILGNDMQPASSSLIAAVQLYIDPSSLGKGEGKAPIGAYCTVTTATPVSINVACTATLVPGYPSADVLENVKAAIDDYLDGIAFEQNFVSYAQIALAVATAEGVADYTNLTVNNGTANITLTDRQVAVRGTVTIG